MTTSREKLIEAGAKVVRYVRNVTVQRAEIAIPNLLFAEILRLNNRLWLAPLQPWRVSVY